MEKLFNYIVKKINYSLNADVYAIFNACFRFCLWVVTHKQPHNVQWSSKNMCDRRVSELEPMELFDINDVVNVFGPIEKRITQLMRLNQNNNLVELPNNFSNFFHQFSRCQFVKLLLVCKCCFHKMSPTSRVHIAWPSTLGFKLKETIIYFFPFCLSMFALQIRKSSKYFAHKRTHTCHFLS